MKTIPQRELRNRSGEILRNAERGQRFVITVDGRPVAELGPCSKPSWVSKREYASALAGQGGDATFFEEITGMGDAALDRRWSR